MAPRNYECMFLLDSSRYSQDPSGTEEELREMIGRVGGDLVAHAPFQDGKLAYEIAGRRKGLHYLTYFKADSSAIDELNRVARLSENVLRHLVIELEDRLFEPMSGALLQHTEGDEEAGQEAAGEVPATA